MDYPFKDNNSGSIEHRAISNIAMASDPTTICCTPYVREAKRLALYCVAFSK